MERVNHDFAERVCTRYTLSIHAEVDDYRERLNAIFTGAHLQVMYLVASENVSGMTVITFP